mgnify:CR=1 FL=1
MHGRISKALTVITIFALLATGCTSQAYNIGMAKDKEHRVIDTGFSASTVGSYDSADTAVVMTVDQDNSGIIFMNMDTGRQYTLYYDGTTYVTDKYDGPMSISQIRAGDVVDVNFLKGKRQIASIKQSPDAWVYDSIDNYDLGGLNKTASIGNSTYSLPDEAVILSEGKRVEAMEIVSQDLVTIRGIDRKIYSVNVERGHGYLRLRNEQALIGGWIEVGNKVIREISEDMLLVVPEGSYQVALSNGGVSSIKDVVIERDRETVLDVSDIEIVQDKTGRILFTVNPAGADVSIDGELTDISSPVELPYGIHKIHMEADGYDSLTKYIQVGSEYAKISFELEEKKEEEAPTISGNDLTVPPLEEKEIPELEYAPVKDPEPSVSDNTISATKSNKVYIDSPKGVEVYLDGNYVGIAPVSFKKNAGKHTITLEKSGYKKKSYTIYLYNDGEDVTYSFSELEREEKPSISDNNVGNDKDENPSKPKPDDPNNKPSVSDNDVGGGNNTGGDGSGGNNTGGDGSGGDNTGGDSSGGGNTGGDSSGGGNTEGEGGDGSGGGNTEGEGGDGSGGGNTEGEGSDGSGSGNTEGEGGDGTGGDNIEDEGSEGTGSGNTDGKGPGSDNTNGKATENKGDVTEPITVTSIKKNNSNNKLSAILNFARFDTMARKSKQS